MSKTENQNMCHSASALLSYSITYQFATQDYIFRRMLVPHIKANHQHAADKHGQPGINIPEAGKMDRGRTAGGSRDGDKCTWSRTSIHTDRHGQPGIHIQEPGKVEGGRRAGGSSDGDKFEGTWGGTSRHTDKYGQCKGTLRLRRSLRLEGGIRSI